VPGLDADVVVVGAGVVGAATARALARDGRGVVLLDQFEVGHDRGSSHGRSRIFRLSYPDERYVRLAQASLGGWRELEEESGREILVTTGSVELGGFVSSNARALSACGVSFEVVEAGTAVERWPIRLAPDEVVLHQPDAGTLLADTALRSETIVARTVVVAAGPWAPRLLTGICDLPVVPTRETVAHFRMPDSRSTPCVVDDATPEHGDALRADSLTYALSSPGLGVKVGLHHSGRLADPDEPGAPDPGVVEWAAEWVSTRFPTATPEPALVETCFYTSTADESFVLERHGRVVVASACSGHAFKFAPALARTVAALAADAVAAAGR
jgi:sarcosine oxidase